MKQPDKSDTEVPAADPDSKKQRRIQRLNGAISYYGSKIHVVLTIIGTVFGIIEINYGVDYNGQCQIQPMISIFLIVHGSVMLLEVVVGILALLISRVIYPKYDQVLARRLIFAVILFVIFVNLFCFAWFIAGNVWVFGAANNGYQNTNPNTSTYCEVDLFRAAFGIIISRYAIVAIIIIVVLVKICKREKAPSVNGTESVPPDKGIESLRM
jgi:hypothetical protein